MNYANKFDYLVEMDKFLEKYNLCKLTHDEIEKLNSFIYLFIFKKKIPTKKSPDGFSPRVHQTITGAFTLILYKLFQKIEGKKVFLNLFYEVSIQRGKMLNSEETLQTLP